MIKQPGEPCTLTIDHFEGLAPVESAVYRSEAGSCYRVLEATKVNSRIHPNRWRLQCVKLDPDDVEVDDVVYTFWWNRR